MIIEFLVSICFIVTILFILFNSDAIPEYLRLFKISKIFPIINEYFSQRLNSPMTVYNFMEFIGDKYNKYFIIRIISCPICLGFYLCLFSLFLLSWWLFPIVYISSLFLYFLLRLISQK